MNEIMEGWQEMEGKKGGMCDRSRYIWHVRMEGYEGGSGEVV